MNRSLTTSRYRVDRATLLLLVRHGRRIVKPREDQMDVDNATLSSQGLAQAARAAYLLRQLPIAGVYSSPHPRAYQTAEVIAFEHGLPVTIIDDLHEWHVTWDRFMPQRTVWKAICKAWPNVKAPGGKESISDLIARGKRVYEHIARRHPNELVVVCGHNTFMKYTLSHLVGRVDLRGHGFDFAEGSVAPLQRYAAGHYILLPILHWRYPKEAA